MRATNHCRLALLAGFVYSTIHSLSSPPLFHSPPNHPSHATPSHKQTYSYTTYRDLGTEGLYSSDTSLRDIINRNLTPGPRLLVATEALASSSGYALRLESHSHLSPSTHSAHSGIPRLSDPCDGPTACRAAVRRRLGAGADIIKFYADYRRRTLRFPPPAYPGGPDVRFAPVGFERNPASVLFSQEEMDAIVSEAHRAKCPVAAHAATVSGVIMAAQAGVTSVEHGFVRSDEAVEAMKEHGTIFVPTLAVVEAEGGGPGNTLLREAMAQTYAAWMAGVKFAAGGDTGAFAHGRNVREVELMVAAGVPLEDVLEAVTLGGWMACGGEWCGRRFGGVKVGWSADFVAVEGDVRGDLGALRRVRWVVKDGEVVVKEGRLVEVGL